MRRMTSLFVSAAAAGLALTAIPMATALAQDKKPNIVVVMGDDWADSDRFDYLKDHCELVFLPRTDGVSTTDIKEDLGGGR